MGASDAPTKPPKGPPPLPRRTGFGGLIIPAKKPTLPIARQEPISAPVHEPTVIASPPPAKYSAPQPEVTGTLKNFPPPPQSSITPGPESVAARVRVGDVDVRVGKTFASKLKGWIVPLLVTSATSVGGATWGYAKGYAEGMLKATRRVDALEATVAAEKRAREKREAADDETDKRVDEYLDTVFKVQRDHDARLIKTEKALDDAIPKIQGLPPKQKL